MVGLNLFAEMALGRTQFIYPWKNLGPKSVSVDGRYLIQNTGDPSDELAEVINVIDTSTGEVTRIPYEASGAKISSDGHYVLCWDNIDGVWRGVYDRTTGTILSAVYGRDSIHSGEPYKSDIANNGRMVYTLNRDIYFWDPLSGNSGVITAGYTGAAPSISGNGRYVFYYLYNQIYRFDTMTGIRTQLQYNNIAIIGSNIQSTIDGQKIVFLADDSNLVPGDDNGVKDVFVYDIQNNVLKRISVSNEGQQANGASYDVSISENGRYVAFSCTANNLVSGDTNGKKDIFLYDLTNDTIQRVSTSDTGVEEANNDSYNPLVNDNGNVYFYTDATNLVSGQGGGLYVWTPSSPPAVSANKITVSGALFDADNDPITLTASVGTVVNNGDGTWTWSYNDINSLAQGQIVTVTADDGHGGITNYKFTVSYIVN